MSFKVFSLVSLVLCFLLAGSSAEQCGTQAGGAVCPGGLCCSQWGWCGTGPDYCGAGCQSQCGGGGLSGGDLGSIIPRDKYDQMLKHRNDCTSKGFYSYDAFISAAKSFPAFGTIGDTATRKREVAAFLAQASHETTGLSTTSHQVLDRLFRFWMTPQCPKPSCHDVITGRWQPSAADHSAGRVPGYGVITNIINGGLECGHGRDPRIEDRIGLYKRYCGILGVGYGYNLDCSGQRPFGSGLLPESM